MLISPAASTSTPLPTHALIYFLLSLTFLQVHPSLYWQLTPLGCGTSPEWDEGTCIHTIKESCLSLSQALFSSGTPSHPLHSRILWFELAQALSMRHNCSPQPCANTNVFLCSEKFLWSNQSTTSGSSNYTVLFNYFIILSGNLYTVNRCSNIIFKVLLLLVSPWVESSVFLSTQLSISQRLSLVIVLSITSWVCNGSYPPLSLQYYLCHNTWLTEEIKY